LFKVSTTVIAVDAFKSGVDVRVLALANFQCFSSSLATTRSIVLFVPNGLPHPMQWKGSSSFNTRYGAFHAWNVDLTLVIIAIIEWNRLAIPSRSPTGSYQPASARSRTAAAMD
jgi:hypothetical protein